MTRQGNLRYVLSVRPAEFTQWSGHFLTACQLLVNGEVKAARNEMLKFDGQAVTYWYHFTAQNAGRDRVVLLGGNGGVRASLPGTKRSKERMPSLDSISEIYERDRFRCRYCQGPVLPPSTLKLVSDSLGINLLKQRKNLETHGVQWLHCATVDHVKPHALGGSSHLNNVVTACKACQFGKGRYSLDQLKISLRGPAPDLRLRGTWWKTIALQLGSVRS